MAKITKDMIIADVLRMDRETAPIFMRHGLHCLGCPASSMESIADAAMVHGLSVDALINDLNEFFAKKGE
ncbi:DUF1858 domain-containing protein [Geosporobacter ferrireducens]|uniref:Disulfide oxidoreductase n=1 Tax=Geosporobacter ferrireducens TaxID=1424294 RepID=A0A1D8GI05_9FIRM|nr:DUF1858 domain-containing protein [Geosporobacter ferrireducens]AOT70535.1 disulfide oxidoreductase [Geosporobacter ferrireducens]MTI57105.1 DUF1858 domain-containing protein [Geosporobacter ferrireducens]